MKLIVSIFFLAVTINSCKKSSDDGYYIINAVVLDLDSKIPISGVKVYSKNIVNIFSINDSAITDSRGRVSFRRKKKDEPVFLSFYKLGYLEPYNTSILTINRLAEDRTDSIFLARPTYLNVNLHKIGTYQNNDSILLGFKKFLPNWILGSPLNTLTLTEIYNERRLANAADTTLNLETIYFSAPYQRAYFYWDIIRNGNVISSNSDSTELIQFDTKNYSLNY